MCKRLDQFSTEKKAHDDDEHNAISRDDALTKPFFKISPQLQS